MHCPQCGVNIPIPGTKCPACNANLMQPCPRCTFRNLIGQQFCGHCNADLTVVETRGVVEGMSAKAREQLLNHYPVLSVEILNLEQLETKLGNAAQASRVTRDLMVRMESQLVSQNANIESIRGNVIFFSFRQDANLGVALSRALKVAIALSKKVINLQGINLTLRVGMDVIHANERGPMTAVPERLVAHSGQVIVSHNIFKMSRRQLPYDPIGPIKVQGQMLTFFRIVTDAEEAKAMVKTIKHDDVVVKTDPRTGKAPVPHTMDSPATDATRNAVQMPAPEPVAPRMERKFEAVETATPPVFTLPEYITSQDTPKRPNIGYHQALQALEGDFGELVTNRDRQGRIIALCGEEGLGKSTIINMVRAQMPPDTLFWVGGNFFEATASNRFPMYFWIELIQNLMGLPTEGIPVAQGEEHIKNVLKAMFNDEVSPDKLDFMRSVFALNPLEPISPAVRQKLGRMIPQLLDVLTSMAKTRPLVLIMENLEYADTASIELLLQLIQHDLLQSNVSILLTYVPDLVFTGPLQQALSLMPYKEYILEPASEEILMSMAEPPLAVPWKKLPDNFRAQLIEKGSPMFLEEAFRWLHANGGLSINTKTGKFTPEKKMKDLQVPEDIRQVIHDRLGKQDETSRYVMMVASVLGERFSTNVLADLTQIPDQFEEVLKTLWQNGFILPDTGSMARFRHHLIWQVVYHGMEEGLRKKLHLLVGDYFEQARSKGFCINPVYVALNSTMGENMPSAIKGWGESGVWYADLGSVTAANIAFNTMQKLSESTQATPDPLQEKRLMESLGLLNTDVNPEYAKTLFLNALEMKGLENPAEQVQLQLFLAQAYDRLGSYAHAAATIHRALEALPQDENTLERIALASEEVWYLYLQGKYQEALLVYTDELKPSILLAGEAPWTDPALRPSYFRGELARARIALMQMNANAFNIIDKAVTQCDIHNEQIMAIHFRLTRSLGYLLKGNYEGCQREMEVILEEIEGLNHPPDVMVWWGLIVLMYHCDMGDWQNASMLIPNTSYQAEQARDYLAWCTCQALAGRISVETGNYGEAQKLLEQAVTVSAEYQLSHPALIGWRYIAENELKIDNLDMAEQICGRAIEVAEKPHINNLLEYYQLTITMAKILLARKEYKQAGALLEKYWPVMVKSGYTPLVAEAALQISNLYGKLSADLPEPHKGKYRAQQASFLQKAKTLWQEQGNKYRLAPYLREDTVTVS